MEECMQAGDGSLGVLQHRVEFGDLRRRCLKGKSFVVAAEVVFGINAAGGTAFSAQSAGPGKTAANAAGPALRCRRISPAKREQDRTKRERKKSATTAKHENRPPTKKTTLGRREQQSGRAKKKRPRILNSLHRGRNATSRASRYLLATSAVS